MNWTVAAVAFSLLLGLVLGGTMGYQFEKPAAISAGQADAFKLGWIAAKCQDHANGTTPELCKGAPT